MADSPLAETPGKRSRPETEVEDDGSSLTKKPRAEDAVSPPEEGAAASEAPVEATADGAASATSTDGTPTNSSNNISDDSKTTAGEGPSTAESTSSATPTTDSATSATSGATLPTHGGAPAPVGASTSSYSPYAAGTMGASTYGATGGYPAAAGAPGATGAAAPSSSLPIPESLSPDPPSKVLHFRNVIPEISQHDLMALCTPFGAVDKVVMMRSKNQALIEFKEMAHAIMLINFYINTTPQVRGRKIYCRYSRHTQLKSTETTINRILLTTMQTGGYGTPFPITADVVWQIYSPYGFIEKIVVILKEGHDMQCLVQYTNTPSATSAMQYLNGKTVYVGTDPILSLTLYVQYSNLSDLTVRANSATCRNYVEHIPWAATSPYGDYGMMGGAMPHAGMAASSYAPPPPAAGGAVPPGAAAAPPPPGGGHMPHPHSGY